MAYFFFFHELFQGVYLVSRRLRLSIHPSIPSVSRPRNETTKPSGPSSTSSSIPSPHRPPETDDDELHFCTKSGFSIRPLERRNCFHIAVSQGVGNTIKSRAAKWSTGGRHLHTGAQFFVVEPRPWVMGLGWDGRLEGAGDEEIH